MALPEAKSDKTFSSPLRSLLEQTKTGYHAGVPWRTDVHEELLTELGLKAKSVMDSGGLVSDDLIIALVKDRIAQSDCANGFLFDGFPRTIPQAEALVTAGVELDAVVEIAVEDEEIVQRIAGRRVHEASGRVYHIVYNPPKIAGKDDITGEELVQRKDDTEETVRHRLSVYHSQTKPLVEFYQNLSAKNGGKPKYSHIPGVGSVEAITAKVLEALS